MKKYTRYEVRNTLFRIKNNKPGKDELKEEIWAIIQPQLEAGESINDFTFKWDVNPYNPTEVIRRQDWLDMKKAKYPKQYDKQENVVEDLTVFTGQGKF